MSSGHICRSSGIDTVYKPGRGTPATRVRSTLGEPEKRVYISEWKKRKDRKKRNELRGRGRETPKINHAVLKESR